MAKEGRPSKMTPDTVKKLEEVFALDGTVAEACFYAEISRETYYTWIEKNKELSDRFEALRQRPFLKARQTIVKSLDNPQYAFTYMAKKKKDEFSDRTELTGANGANLMPEATAEAQFLAEQLNKFERNAIHSKPNTRSPRTTPNPVD
jgi:hypothetical protein